MIGPTREGEAGSSDTVPEKDRQKFHRLVIESAIENIFTGDDRGSDYLEVNEVLMKTLPTNIDIALVDMPELLLRMKVAHAHSLADLQDMLNFIMNKLAKKEGPCRSAGQAARYYFPEVFC